MMAINPFDILKNAEMIQSQISVFQEKLGSISVTGTAGGGMAEVDLSGKMEMLDLRIAPEICGDLDMIQDLVVAAHADAINKVKAAIAEELGSAAGLGGLSGLGNIGSLLGGGIS
ncbi:MAG: YbaB/EbfC family nucleoid-associated protein [Spirochaetaceae bacterium]|jgi:DNA-binding YbaB/EbfC family protein|nr:YbaB/EbfC family nucleoid-associated protein [Spirochaetaceae bacterium]